ncbi:MAG: calcium/sodium antiporter [Methanosarcinaceae archaeon]|nr:calcium/sodium antiporter [Methanosarcinaceae archaeon]
MVLLTLGLFVIGLVLITKGADWFVESAVSISTKSGIPKVIIGATIVSFATTAPEFTVSTIAAYLGQTDLTVGNAVGSAICNIGLVLGSVILVRAIPMDDPTFLQRGGFMVLSGSLLVIMTLDGMLTSADGIILLLVFIAFMYYNYRLQSAIFKDGEKTRDSISGMRSDILFFLLGSACVILGSRILIDTGTQIARWLGIPEIVIGLTLIALGTSLPELITAVSSTIKGHHDLAIGNILGANTMNIALILGVSSQICEIPIQLQSIYYDFPVMILLMLLLIIFGITRRRFERWEGGVILTIYLAYIVGLFVLYV